VAWTVQAPRGSDVVPVAFSGHKQYDGRHIHLQCRLPMPATPSRREVTHDRILEVASRAIRRHGVAGVGVADVMKQAGLTHGGFYAHFPSREAMLAEALVRAGRDNSERLSKSSAAREASGASPLRALVERYLSPAHLVGTENGCLVAALASELPRQSEPVRDAALTRVHALLAKVEQALPPGVVDGRAARAMAITSTLVGALQLARVLGDNAQGRAALAAARDAVLAQYEP
jgi:TetR/AcrR family transcriptional regulator, transcriptional repressor for nem operon